MRGGGSVTPGLSRVPMWMGPTSSCVSPCVRTMRGVSSITISVDWADSSLAEKSCLRMGRRSRPGKPLKNLAVLLAQEAREQVRLAVAEAQAGHDLARAERRQRLAGDENGRAQGAVLDLEVENDLVLVGDPRGHREDDADGTVLERGQRVERRAADRERCERGGRHRDLLPEVQLELGPLLTPDLGLRPEPGVGVLLTRGSIEKSIQENDEFDQRGRRRVRAMLE